MNNEAITTALATCGVRQMLHLFSQSGHLSPTKNLCPFNVSVAQDNTSWSDNGSLKKGDVVDLAALAFGITREKAAKAILDLIDGLSSEETEKLHPCSIPEDEDASDPPFPTECLPVLLKEVTAAICDMEGVPDVLAAGALIGAASGCLGSGIAIESKSDKMACGNLYILLEAETGTGKSGVCERAKTPIEDYESKLVNEHSAEMPKTNSRLAIIEKTLRGIGHNKDAAESDELLERITALETERLQLEARRMPPILLTGDSTSERLIEIMSANGGATLSMSGEARSIVQVLTGFYNEGRMNESIYLSGFTVMEHVRQNRVGRGDGYIERPCLAIVWMLQSDAFAKLWDNKSLAEGGLLPRFLSCRTFAKLQYVDADRKVFPAGLAERYQARLNELLEAYRLHKGNPIVAKASTEARGVIADYTNRIIERRMSGDLSKRAGGFAARWGEISWKLALVLHAVEHGAKAHAIEVTPHTARCAVAVVSWFALQQLDLIGEREKADEDDKQVKVLTLAKRSGRTNARLVAKAGICDVKQAATLLNQLVKDGMLESADRIGAGRPTRYYYPPSNPRGGPR